MKKFNSIFLLMLIFFASTSYAQIKHTKFSTVLTIDRFNTSSGFYNSTIAEIPDSGGYIVSKYFDDGTYGCRPSMMKLDFQGNIVLDTVFEMNPYDGMAGSGMVNNVTTLTGNAMLYSTNAAFPGGGTAPYLMKTDFNGNVLWQYAYSDDATELLARQLISTIDGGYMIIGNIFDFIGTYTNQGGLSMKIDANGLLEWSKLYSNTDTMSLSFSAGLQTDDGGYFYAGSTENLIGGQRTLTPQSVLVNMVRTDVNGATLWSKGVIFDGPVNTESIYDNYSCGMLNDSNAFVSFSVQDTSNNANVTKLAMTSVNVFTGATNWTKLYSLPFMEQLSIRKAISDRNGNIIFSANDYNNNAGVIFMFDQLGSLIRTKKFSTTNSGNFVNNTITTIDGGFMNMSEVDYKNILLVKTNGDLDPSCPDVDSLYLLPLTSATLGDTSYLAIADTTVDMVNVDSVSFAYGVSFSIQSIDSVICVCSNALTGVVYDGASPAVNAKVFLFKKGMIPLPWQAYDSTITDALGSYSFYDFPTDSFIVRVEPDPILQANAITSYYKQVGFCYKWDSAGVFYVHCDSGLVVNDIDLINITPMTGNSSLSGYVFENTGGFNKGFVPGDPLPGMDITVEQSPGGIVGTSTTDGNGFYDLPNLDNSATYIISMDLPGLPMDSVYTMIINLSDTVFDSLNFYVDTTGIYIRDNSSSVGINVIDFDDLKVVIYPNPSSSNFNLVINAIKPEEVEYELINEFGQTIINNNTILNSGDNMITIDAKDLSQGIYFLKIKQFNKIYIKKLIKM